MKTTLLCILTAAALALVACNKAPAPAPQAEKPKVAVMVKGATVQAAERAFPRFLRVTGSSPHRMTPWWRRIRWAKWSRLRLNVVPW